MTTFDMDNLDRAFIRRGHEPVNENCSIHRINDIGVLPGGFNL